MLFNTLRYANETNTNIANTSPESNIGTLIPKKVKLSKNTIFAIFTCSLHYKGIKSHTSHRLLHYFRKEHEENATFNCSGARESRRDVTSWGRRTPRLQEPLATPGKPSSDSYVE